MKLKIFTSFFCLFFLQALVTKACQCPLTALSLDECNKYQIIFRGKVISNTTCNNKPGEVTFDIIELYRGKIRQQFKVVYECNEECSSTFNAGEEWIIYTNYRQIDNAKMNWCSRSRKFFKNEKEDFYTVTYGNTYEDELVFLRKNLGTYKVLENHLEADAGPRNIIPSKTQIIITLFVSLAVVVLFLQLFNKYFK